MAVKTDAASAQIPVFLFAFIANVAQQAAQHRQVQLLVAGRLVVQVPALLADHRMQLRMNVAPFAHPADIDEVLAQEGFVLTIAELMDCGFTPSPPGRGLG